jgi:hypothetical protein
MLQPRSLNILLVFSKGKTKKARKMQSLLSRGSLRARSNGAMGLRMGSFNNSTGDDPMNEHLMNEHSSCELSYLSENLMLQHNF